MVTLHVLITLCVVCVIYISVVCDSITHGTCTHAYLNLLALGILRNYCLVFLIILIDVEAGDTYT